MVEISQPDIIIINVREKKITSYGFIFSVYK